MRDESFYVMSNATYFSLILNLRHTLLNYFVLGVDPLRAHNITKSGNNIFDGHRYDSLVWNLQTVLVSQATRINVSVC